MLEFLKKLSETRLSSSSAVLLAAAAKENGVTQTKAAELANVSTAAMTGAADMLEKRGLAERKRLIHDRRIISVQATASGLALLAEMQAALKSEQAR